VTKETTWGREKNRSIVALTEEFWGGRKVDESNCFLEKEKEKEATWSFSSFLLRGRGKGVSTGHPNFTTLWLKKDGDLWFPTIKGKRGPKGSCLRGVKRLLKRARGRKFLGRFCKEKYKKESVQGTKGCISKRFGISGITAGGGYKLSS